MTLETTEHAGDGQPSPTPAKQPSHPPTWTTVKNVLLGLLLVVLLVSGVWSAYWADFRNDQYQLIHLGQVINDGGHIYLDGWENKPPGIAWLCATGVWASAGGTLGAWILPVIVALLALVTLHATMRSVLSARAADVTTFLAAILLTIRIYDAATINPDYYSALFDLIACSVWVLSVSAARWRSTLMFGLLAGLAWSAAMLSKQTGAIGPVVIIATTLILAIVRVPGCKRWLLTCLASCAAIGGALAAVAWTLRSRGNLTEAWAAIYSFNSNLLNTDSVTGLLHAWPRIVNGLGTVQIALWLGLLGLIATWRVGKDHKPSPATVTALTLWFLAQGVAALLGPSGSMRYWLSTFPPLIWLTGIGLEHLFVVRNELTKAHRSVFSIVTVTLLAILFYPVLDSYRAGLAASYVAYTDDSSQRRVLEMQAQQLQTLCTQDDRIYVWDYDAGLYVHSGCRAASRYTYPRSAQQMTQILADLRENKPYVLLIPKGGGGRFEPLCDELCKSALADLLTDYHAAKPIGRYDVWTRTN